MSDSNGPGFETSGYMRTIESNPSESNRLVIKAALLEKVNIKPFPNKVKVPNQILNINIVCVLGCWIFAG
jgi:hypothetical protein